MYLSGLDRKAKADWPGKHQVNPITGQNLVGNKTNSKETKRKSTRPPPYKSASLEHQASSLGGACILTTGRVEVILRRSTLRATHRDLGHPVVVIKSRQRRFAWRKDTTFSASCLQGRPEPEHSRSFSSRLGECEESLARGMFELVLLARDEGVGEHDGTRRHDPSSLLAVAIATTNLGFST